MNTRVCCDCIETRACKACGIQKTEDLFSKYEWIYARYSSENQGHYKSCSARTGNLTRMQPRHCKSCNMHKPSEVCSDSKVLSCKGCLSKRNQINQWTCHICKETFPTSAFDICYELNNYKDNNYKHKFVKCNTCVEKTNEEERRQRQTYLSNTVLSVQPQSLTCTTHIVLTCPTPSCNTQQNTSLGKLFHMDKTTDVWKYDVVVNVRKHFASDHGYCTRDRRSKNAVSGYTLSNCMTSYTCLRIFFVNTFLRIFLVIR